MAVMGIASLNPSYEKRLGTDRWPMCPRPSSPQEKAPHRGNAVHLSDMWWFSEGAPAWLRSLTPALSQRERGPFVPPGCPAGALSSIADKVRSYARASLNRRSGLCPRFGG
ncbi:hypothetical protein Pssp01_15770 [Pseudomonas sp. NBRC 100443]|nr:hypothetical protein Pssp01_15770 [Pseudomonas sp. NBRC 100443]